MKKVQGKIKVKEIVLAAVAVIIIGVIIAANIVLDIFKTPITLWFTNGGYADVDSEERDNALLLGDELVADVVADSIVLLKNENNALPLEKGTKLNLFGWNSTDKGFLLAGGGSGGVNINDKLKITLTDALEEAKIEYNKDLIAAYEKYNNSVDMDLPWESNMFLLNPGADFYTDALMQQAKSFSDTAIIVLTRYGRENGSPYFSTVQQQKYDPNRWCGSDGDKSRTYLETSVEEDAMIEKVTAAFDKVIVLLNVTNPIEVGFLDNDKIDAALYVGAPGQSGTRAIPKILFGDVSPSGRVADTYVYHHKDAPSFANATYLPSERNGRYVSDDLKKYMENIHYQEGIYVGYRWYETAFADKVKFTVNDRVQDFSTEDGYRKIVKYPFGYGLSYTQFKWEVVEAPQSGAVIDEDSEFEVKVRVTNTGTVEGKEVVQLYYTPPYYKGGIEKAAMNLLAFGKTVSLKPANLTSDGIPESQVITLKFSGYDMASYDCYDKNDNGFETYELDIGDYRIRLMQDAHTPADVEGGEITLNVPGASADDAIIYLIDPDTEELVENRFTGEEAYAGVPMDGSTVHNGGVEYMSRADFDKTFPRVRHLPPDNRSAVNAASNYSFDDFGTVPSVTYNNNGGLYLVTRADGSKANANDLEGKGAELKYNVELMEKLLADDNAPEWNTLLSQISEQETVTLIRQGGFQTVSVPSLGMSRVADSDGPTGFSSLFDTSGKQMSVAFPSESTIACSWNLQNAYNVGRVQGVVAKSRIIGGWYAPSVNIHRSPYGSRNFETYSEDPVISGKMAAETVRGGKHNGMRCFLKHFVMDDNGDNPWDYNTWATEQAMREIYLKPFEIAVKAGDVNAVMSSFNRIGASWAGGNRALLTDILRTEWGFKGTVITDAVNGYMDCDKGVRAGNNLWLNMSGDRQFGELKISNPKSAYAARQAVKNMVYLFADTYMASKNFAEFGDPNDPYKVNVDKVAVSETPHSPLFSFLWFLIDFVFAAGLALCIFFVLYPRLKKETTKLKRKRNTPMPNEIPIAETYEEQSDILKSKMNALRELLDK